MSFSEDKTKNDSNLYQMVKVEMIGSLVVVMPTEVDRVTVVNAGELKGVLMEQFSNTTCDVVLDLGNIKFIDSTGISVLISGVKASREKDRKFTLRNVRGEVAKLLALMKIDKILDIEK
jgi:anti-sigma B factor antagonist